jgi:asparagine synthase (glutamine-hydrolysing)
MCGILGVFSGNAGRDDRLMSAVNAMRHRGPDDNGVWFDESIVLGHTRLAILDLSPLGHQPMSDSSKNFWITFNGEIYNYLELRKELLALGHHFTSETDTEVILAAYAQWGSECLSRLRGMFAFGIWDRERQNLFLARDRTGEKPLYYYVKGKSLYFASELRSLLRLLPEKPQLNPTAIDAYLHYQYVPEPLTPLAGVMKLPPAHYLNLRQEDWQVSPQSYWSLENIAQIEGDPAVLIRQELDRVIELTLRSDVPVGVSLSGGIDSGAIASLAAPKYRDTLQAFSVGYPGRPAYDERHNAAKLAKGLGLPFFEIELGTETLVEFFPSLVAMGDEPVADIAAYAHYSVSRLAADHGVKVVLGGIGGDELFWGYAWCVDAVELSERKINRLRSGQLNVSSGNKRSSVTQSPLYQKALVSPKVPPEIRKVLRRLLGDNHLNLQYPHQAVFYDQIPEFNRAVDYCAVIYTQKFNNSLIARSPYQFFDRELEDCSDVPSRICRLLFDTWLASNCLSLGDRLSMASSVETRLPFLDAQLIELVMGLRKATPDHALGYKAWLKLALKDVLPDEVLNRPKQGFQPPFKIWITSILNKYIDRLESGYLLELKVVDSYALAKMIDEYKESGKHVSFLYKLLTLEIWYQEVVASVDLPCFQGQLVA